MLADRYAAYAAVEHTIEGVNRPRILIPIPTSFDEPYNAKSWPEYANAVSASGGEAIRVPLDLTSRELERLAKDAAGMLLPGSGADIDPVLYGHQRDPATSDPDPLRAAADRVLLETAERHRKPLLGVCAGLQAINVYYGGTLIQDVSPVPVNHRAARSVAAAHGVAVTRETRLAKSIGLMQGSASGDEVRVTVNSSHHQAVDAVGESLRVSARSPEDNVIEALEGSDPDRWLLGVQWHPERTLEVSEASRALFANFVRACASPWQS